MAELADASDSKSDIARCVGSTPTPGTIFTKPSEIFVPAVSFFLRMREQNEKTIQILKAFRLRFQKSYSIIESIDDSHDRQNGACDIQGRFCKRVSARRSNARARSRLFMIDAATCPQDLTNPPSNRLELLRGDLSGWWSIRINQQWRIIFQWSAQGAENVKITDYH